jgi:hypothetical protein
MLNVEAGNKSSGLVSFFFYSSSSSFNGFYYYLGYYSFFGFSAFSFSYFFSYFYYYGASDYLDTGKAVLVNLGLPKLFLHETWSLKLVNHLVKLGKLFLYFSSTNVKNAE